MEGSFKDTNKPVVEVEGKLPKNVPGKDQSFLVPIPLGSLLDNETLSYKQLGTEKIAYLFKLQFDNKVFHLGAFSEDELNSWLSFFHSTDSQKKVV